MKTYHVGGGMLKVNTSEISVSLEEKLRQMTTNNEPIKGNAEMRYTERREGVLPEYDIRTDRFDVALQAMDRVSKTAITKRQERINAAQETQKESA